jgi:class 3 adenylate cyclase
MVERVRVRLEEVTAGVGRVGGEVSAAAASGALLDWPALTEATQALQLALEEDDAAARKHLQRLVALVAGTPLEPAVAILKRPVETYAYGQALERFEGLLKAMDLLR